MNLRNKYESVIVSKEQIYLNLIDELLFEEIVGLIEHTKWNMNKKERENKVPKNPFGELSHISVKDKVDIYQNYNNYETDDRFKCDHCNRIVSTVRYTHHLERCMKRSNRRRSRKNPNYNHDVLMEYDPSLTLPSPKKEKKKKKKSSPYTEVDSLFEDVSEVKREEVNSNGFSNGENSKFGNEMNDDDLMAGLNLDDIFNDDSFIPQPQNDEDLLGMNHPPFI